MKKGQLKPCPACGVQPETRQWHTYCPQCGLEAAFGETPDECEANWNKMETHKQCACGCGAVVTADSRGRPRSYLQGHGGRGKKHSAEWVAKQAAGVRRAWANPSKMVACRNQPAELIERRAAKLRGREVSAETRAKISAANTGRKLSPEHRLKTSAGWLHGYPSLSEEAKAKCRRSQSLARLGCHNFGRAARDRLDHFNARHWIVRDPVGRIYEFDNAQAWARKNEALFLPDECPEARLPLWRRFVSGLNDMQRTDRKGSHSWRGWVLVSCVERASLGAPDPLGRELEGGE